MKNTKKTCQPRARWCPLCGTQHTVEEGQPNPWQPNITRDQIESIPALLAERDRLRAALQGAIDLLNNSSVRFLICDGGRGHLGEQALFHRTLNSALEVLAEGGK